MAPAKEDPEAEDGRDAGQGPRVDEGGDRFGRGRRRVAGLFCGVVGGLLHIVDDAAGLLVCRWRTLGRTGCGRVVGLAHGSFLPWRWRRWAGGAHPRT